METFSLTDSVNVSRLGLGGCPFGGHGWGPVDDQDSIRAIRRAYELGLNFFDTADVYGFGHSERILRKALGSQRHSVHIATKFGVRWDAQGRTWKDASPDYLCQALDASLQRLGVECIGLYYLHWPDPQTPMEQTVEALEKMRRQGKIHAIGLSNIPAEQLHIASSIAPIAAVQIQYSLVDQDKFELLAPLARKMGIRLITWGSLAQGLLSGKYDGSTKFSKGDRRLRYDNFQGEKLRHNLRLVQELMKTASELEKTPAQVALRWLLDTSSVGSVLFGAKSIKQVEENLGAFDFRLPQNAYVRLKQLGQMASRSHLHHQPRKIAS